MAKLDPFAKRRQRVRTKLRARGLRRPRLSVHRSGRHIYAQIIDDVAGHTVAAASTLEKDARATTGAPPGASRPNAISARRQRRSSSAMLV